jgi:hypothetical protein
MAVPHVLSLFSVPYVLSYRVVKASRSPGAYLFSGGSCVMPNFLGRLLSDF